MHLLQITLGSGATPIIPKAVVPANSASWSMLIIQNNAGHVVRVGDSTVSATKGIALASGSPGGSLTRRSHRSGKRGHRGSRRNLETANGSGDEGGHRQGGWTR